MILNIATVVICFVMMMIFRRIDRANSRMTKLRRYSSRIFDDFKKMTEKENRKFHDSTIEMDILIKKSGALAKNLSEAIVEIENRLKGLDVEKTNLKRVEDDIKVISGAAKDVNKQIQFIASAKENFGDMTGNISFLTKNMENMKQDLGDIVQNFEDKLRERSREISEEFYVHADNLKSDLERKENELAQTSRDRTLQLAEEFSKSVNEMEEKVAESSNILHDNFKMKIAPLVKTVDNAEDLNNQIEKMRETFTAMENTFFDDFKSKSRELKSEINTDIDKLTQKLQNVEANVDDSRTKLIQTFENEVDKVRTELDNLSIHAVSKKDEIVQATRREAEGIKKRIEDFEDRFVELENRIVDTAEEKLDTIDTEYQAVETRLNTLIGRIKEEEIHLDKGFNDLEGRLDNIKNEIVRYEQNNDVFGRTDTMINKVETSVSNMGRMLEEAQSQSKELDKFISDIEQIKDLKKTADREIRAYMGKKAKLGDIENEIKGLLEINDMVVGKSDELLENVSKIDLVNHRIDALSEAYSSVEKRIEELREYEDVISTNLDSVTRSDLIIQSIDSRIKSFEKVIDRSDKRVDKIGNQLKKVEEETIILKTKENDIREIKDKLNEVDGLSEHMEERIKQIHAMFQKVETIRKEIDVTDSKLQDMFSQTDLKMKEFSDFIQAVDNNNPISKQVKGDIKAMPGKNINNNIVRTVRELSDKGWDPEAISRKLMIDENSIRFIINTTSL